MSNRFKTKLFCILLCLTSSAMAIEVTRQNAVDIALDSLKKNLSHSGLTKEDLSNAIVKDLYTTQHNGVTHVYLRQTLHGLEIFNAELAVNLTKDGEVINTHNNFIRALSRVNLVRPRITAVESINRAAEHLNLTVSEPLEFISASEGYDLLLTDGGLSEDNIPVKLMYEPYNGSVRLVWQSILRLKDGKNWLDMRIDALNGELLGKNNWVDDAGIYNVITIPRVTPEDGLPLNAQNTVTAPADPIASPFGWHDTDGIVGREFNETRGNNVFAQEDVDANNTGGFRPSGTISGMDLIFDIFWDVTLEPLAGDNQSAAIVNLFYANNVIHDILYHYGFDEAGGNFQVNNYGKGGLANDQVNADAQDGSGTNNANFGTPPDGSSPRMQMFLWNTTSPGRDGDFENGIIFHEYGHGVSNRLTGGPNNVSCLSNAEQMGEGWSDFFATHLTTKATDTGATATGVGPYVLGQDNDTGLGIRPTQYSTDMTVNPTTYGDISGLAVPHGVGYAWATMLWEMQWALIDQHGFDPDFYNGIGGNNLTLQLVMDGMKLQPCSPGFVDGRDAILAADQVNNGGANECLIWGAFAKRGLGFSADQGSSGSTGDGTEAFDLPPVCLNNLKIEKTGEALVVKSRDKFEYTLKAINDTAGALTNVVITDDIPLGTTYVNGSASCPVTNSAGTLSFEVGSLASGASKTCLFSVKVTAPSSVTVFQDDMESGMTNWVVNHNEGSIDWLLTNTNPHSGSFHWFAEDINTTTDQYLELVNPVAINDSNYQLTFWHEYNTEVPWDGGVVEISIDGGVTWVDLGVNIIKNGYTGTIPTSDTNPLAGRNAFTGASGGYIKTTVDLSSFNGENIVIRFRLGTDSIIGVDGWSVDDVAIGTFSSITNQACVNAAEGDNACSLDVLTPIEGTVKESGFQIPIRRADGSIVMITMPL